MSSVQKDPGYLNYGTYAHFKDKFNPYYGITYDENRLNKFIKESITNSTQELKYKDAFKELFRHIVNMFTIASDTDNACKYVSYILRNEIQKVDQKTYNDKIFSVFKNFAQAFKKDKNFRNEQCETKMVNIDSSVFPQMKTLYELYDMHYKLKSTSVYYVKERCDTFGLMIKKYNEAIEEYQLKDKQEEEKAKKLQEERDQQQREQQRREQQQREQQQREQQQREQQQREQQQREQQQREQEERLKSLLPSYGDVSGTPSALRTQKNDLSPSLVNVQEGGLSANRMLSREQQHLKGNKFTYSQTPLLASLGGQREELEPSEVRIHEPESSDLQQSVTPGAFRSLQNSISEFISDVQPAPILGVSGGMGALFLLFKYTPVGSFFGGRRRRIRQIPSSFGGFTPGDFSNFQEYGGGYVGYSPMYINPLAE
uniref:Variable surface protein Vir6-like n=1 Tax=Plasmodium vivax (strain Salvador I) TaxID=126793 RepID=A5KD56_PLAVS